MKAIPVKKSSIDKEKNIVNLYGERKANGSENIANIKKMAPNPRLMNA